MISFHFRSPTSAVLHVVCHAFASDIPFDSIVDSAWLGWRDATSERSECGKVKQNVARTSCDVGGKRRSSAVCVCVMATFPFPPTQRRADRYFAALVALISLVFWYSPCALTSDYIPLNAWSSDHCRYRSTSHPTKYVSNCRIILEASRQRQQRATSAEPSEKKSCIRKTSNGNMRLCMFLCEYVWLCMPAKKSQMNYSFNRSETWSG